MNLKASSYLFLLKVFIIYFGISIPVISATFTPALSSVKNKKEILRAMYIIYILILGMLGILGVVLINENVENSLWVRSKISFAVLFVMHTIIAIIILAIHKGDNRSKTICFAFIAMNLAVTCFYFYILLENTKYTYIDCHQKEHPLSCISAYFISTTHNFKDPENKKEFVRNCVYNLPAIPNQQLMKKIEGDTEAINEGYLNVINREFINNFKKVVKEAEVKDQQYFQETVCDEFYELLRIKQNPIMKSKPPLQKLNFEQIVLPTGLGIS